MSLKFGGSYTPERPEVFSSGTGPGTSCPISFKRYIGSTSADDDICKCQWRLNKAKVECAGSATIRFYDPSSIAPPEDRTVSFSLSKEATASLTGADCSVRLPTNIAPGDSTNMTGNDNDSILVTLPWGPGSIGVAVAFSVGSGNLGITDTTFTEYWKGIELQFSATGVQPGGVASSIQLDTLNLGAAFGVDADVFHDTAPLYVVGSTPTDASVTFTTFKLTATDYLAVP